MLSKKQGSVEETIYLTSDFCLFYQILDFHILNPLLHEDQYEEVVHKIIKIRIGLTFTTSQ